MNLRPRRGAEQRGAWGGGAGMLPPAPAGPRPGRALHYSRLRELWEVSSGAAAAVGVGRPRCPCRPQLPRMPLAAPRPRLGSGTPTTCPAAGVSPQCLVRPGPTASLWAPSCVPRVLLPLHPPLSHQLPRAAGRAQRGTSTLRLCPEARGRCCRSPRPRTGAFWSSAHPPPPGQRYLGPTVSPRGRGRSAVSAVRARGTPGPRAAVPGCSVHTVKSNCLKAVVFGFCFLPVPPLSHLSQPEGCPTARRSPMSPRLAHCSSSGHPTRQWGRGAAGSPRGQGRPGRVSDRRRSRAGLSRWC